MAGISQLILVLFWLSGINAQYGGGQSSTTTTSTSSSVTKSSSSSAQSATDSAQSVDVGKDGFTFSPNTLTASAGDKIENQDALSMFKAAAAKFYKRFYKQFKQQLRQHIFDCVYQQFEFKQHIIAQLQPHQHVHG
ncbi:hypothetical protein N7490_009799 [Penicillium lividum]|nr:hypothetical protein N7490_009799 [Penicillium lividum]